MATAEASAGVGPLLRDWRRRRRLSQLDLALEAGVSARHVSFVETGRSRPSAEMVLQLADGSRSRCAIATGCCSPPATRPCSSSTTSTTPRWSPCAGDRPDPRRPRPLPGGGDRPRTGRCSARNRAVGAPDRRCGARSARAAGERAAPEPAPGRHGAADREPGRVARPPARAPGPPDRPDRRRRAREPARRSSRRTRGPRRRRTRRTRDRGAAAPAQRGRRALLHRHGRHVRHSGRGDGQRALDRVVLPGRRRPRGGAAAVG